MKVDCIIASSDSSGNAEVGVGRWLHCPAAASSTAASLPGGEVDALRFWGRFSFSIRVLLPFLPLLGREWRPVGFLLWLLA
jgi:hypothetical protein